MPERWSIPPDTPIFLDLEASGLSDGFPIEVGWSWCQGGKVMIEACLIKPVQKWLDDFDTRWSLESERVHGILLKDLAYDGYPVDKVVARLSEVFGPGDSNKIARVAYSDAAAFDRVWINELYEAASVHVARSHRVRLLDVSHAFESAGTDEVKFHHKFRAMQLSPTPHRAALDAARWAKLWLETRRMT